MKKVSKKRIVITGRTGLLGSYFYKKYKTKYKIVSYPHRVENLYHQKKWVRNKKFEYFIHFAALTKNNNKKKFLKINTIATINLLKTLLKAKVSDLKYFLFISSSHVYGFSNKSITENKKRIPINSYGKSKKKVEDYIIKNRKKFNFKIGIARIFNFTGYKQKRGYFISDMFNAVKSKNLFFNLNANRDFVHIDDICKSIDLIIRNHFTKPINISSGRKTGLIDVVKIINKKTFNKKINFNLKKQGDIYGNNKLLNSLGKKKFKPINQIVESYIK